MPAIVIAQKTTSGGAAAAGVIILVVFLEMVIATFAGMWATFAKAGEPGWAALIPIYNMVVLLRIVGRPGWWVVLFLLPPVTFVVTLIALMDLAKA